MTAHWTAVETLIGELGAVRAAAFAARASEAARGAIDQAITEATDAVIGTLYAPAGSEAFARAQEAIEVVADVIASLDDELVRTLRIRARGAELRIRAQELLLKARQV
jgi:hypothetical protein